MAIAVDFMLSDHAWLIENRTVCPAFFKVIFMWTSKQGSSHLEPILFVCEITDLYSHRLICIGLLCPNNMIFFSKLY